MYTSHYLEKSKGLSDMLVSPAEQQQVTVSAWDHFNRVKAQDEERRKKFQDFLSLRPSPPRHNVAEDKLLCPFTAHYSSNAARSMPGGSLMTETRNRMARNVESRQPEPNRLSRSSGVSRYYGRENTASRPSAAKSKPYISVTSYSDGLFPSDPNWYVVKASPDDDAADSKAKSKAKKRSTNVVMLSKHGASRLAIPSQSPARSPSVERSGLPNEKPYYFTDKNVPPSFFETATSVREMII